MNPESIAKSHGKVLIIEDNPESIDLLVYFLKPAGYEILTATDSREALTILARELPDIILLDVMLPEVDGFQICEQLKKNERTFHIPIIMITALKELRHKIRGLEVGADDFITKPFDSVELLTRVKSLLRLKFYHDELVRRNQELEHRKKILEREDELKKELTHLIIHDMKSPLFVIQGNLQMMNMMNESGQPSPDPKYTQRIERSSRGLLRMILNLLDISRLEQESMELTAAPVDLSKLLKEMIAYFLDQPQNVNKTVKLNLPESLPRAFIDKDMLERILDNLLNYIFQNTSDHAYILIEIEKAVSDFLIVKLYHEGRYIPEAYQEKIFLKYAQTELKNAGIKPARALGLIFCKMAIEASGGILQIDPEFKQGTGFIMKVPIWKTSRTKSESADVSTHN